MSIMRRLLSPGELEALKAFQLERVIASHHRSGLSLIRRQSLASPARLNLGSGSIRKPGFFNVDLFPGGDVTLDLRRGLPFESNTCEQIFSEHFFEHIDYPEPVCSLFRECLRVLKPIGEFLFSVPDTEWPLNNYREGLDSSYFVACQHESWHPLFCTTRLEHINWHFREGSAHRYAYDFETAQKFLNQAGFVDIRKRAFDASLDSHDRQIGSLFVFARKPA